MARPKLSVNKEIISIARKELTKLKEGKLSLQLRAIISFEDYTAAQVSKIFGLSPRTLFRWITKFKNYGISGLRDCPRGHYREKLKEFQRREIKCWILERKNSKGTEVHWTLLKLQKEISNVFGINISQTSIWRILKNQGLRVKRPRPRHKKGDKELQSVFKKNFSVK